jgi:hypothetical protein
MLDMALLTVAFAKVRIWILDAGMLNLKVANP